MLSRWRSATFLLCWGVGVTSLYAADEPKQADETDKTAPTKQQATKETAEPAEAKPSDAAKPSNTTKPGETADKPGETAELKKLVPAKPKAVWDPLESTCRHASLSIL